MELTEAAAMLANDRFKLQEKQKWADLGCGTGTFTLALAGLLPHQSTIYAVDTNISALEQIPADYNGVSIEKQALDFENEILKIKNVDGILMANSLHYIKDKKSFIQKAIGFLKHDGCFLLVEYDTNVANQWVPYPLSYSSLTEQFNKAGFHSISKLQERDSVFGRAKLYSVIIQRENSFSLE
jgi:ubiquinone/menaquinone biosynthesis C-methylase UbiE